jgi:phenylalanyl-tRNA synthetase beta chain
MRIDGFDNIAIPSTITFSPASGYDGQDESWKEKTTATLVGLGFHEMLNNSITHSAFYTEAELASGVRMMNSLSAELDMLRPSMLETGLQTVAHNLNRKNLDLRLFEFGKTYHVGGRGTYEETDHLCLFVSGQKQAASWQSRPLASDLFYIKGIVRSLFAHLGLAEPDYQPVSDSRIDGALSAAHQDQPLVTLGSVSRSTLDRFDIRQDVWYADIRWSLLMDILRGKGIRYVELPKYPSVQRDLAIVVDKSLAYGKVRETLDGMSIARLRQYQLFDVFESDKLGEGKKSMAMSFRFRDEEKTLTDDEVDQMMQKIIRIFEKDLQAQVRR